MHTQTSGGRCIRLQADTGVPAATLRAKKTRTRTLLSKGKIIRAVLFPAQLYIVYYITVSLGGRV
eukprot:81784-Hanusia_phi.AAC.1